MITIECDSIHCVINNKLDIAKLRSFEELKYKKVWWKQGQYKKQKKEYKLSIVDKNGVFYTGLLKRVEKCLIERVLKYEVKTNFDCTECVKPELEGITFREDQEQALNNLIESGRGVWQAPTGAGKTILLCGLIAAYNNSMTLIIVHTEALFNQTYDELTKFFGASETIGRIGCGHKYKDEGVVVAMIQTLSRSKQQMGFWNNWEQVIVDEVHHVAYGGTYEKVLSKLYAPIRFGFTATPSEERERRLAMEGLLGPVVGKTTYKELQDKDVLAKPRVKVFWTPETNLLDRIEELKKKWAIEDAGSKRKRRVDYKTAYEMGIVNNRKRNELIIEKSFGLIARGLTVLIVVERVEHGEILLALAEKEKKEMFVFLHGNTPSEEREQEKKIFKQKKRRGVIATRIWSEGTNIQTIGAVVNAVGGLSEIACLQRFGRGMRTAEGKKEVILVDFMDSNHYFFQKHSMKRLCLYFEQGWIGSD